MKNLGSITDDKDIVTLEYVRDKKWLYTFEHTMLSSELSGAYSSQLRYTIPLEDGKTISDYTGKDFAGAEFYYYDSTAGTDFPILRAGYMWYAAPYMSGGTTYIGYFVYFPSYSYTYNGVTRNGYLAEGSKVVVMTPFSTEGSYYGLGGM